MAVLLIVQLAYGVYIMTNVNDWSLLRIAMFSFAPVPFVLYQSWVFARFVNDVRRTIASNRLPCPGCTYPLMWVGEEGETTAYRCSECGVEIDGARCVAMWNRVPGVRVVYFDA